MNRNTSSNIENFSKMMNEDRYWELVEESLRKSTDQFSQEKFLTNALVKLGKEDIIGFRLRTYKLRSKSYLSKLWCAAYIIKGGCSDDGFEYFRSWLISTGREMFYSTLENPDILAVFTENERFAYEFESFNYVSHSAFKKITDISMFEFIDYDEFYSREGKYPKLEFDWEEGKPETMKRILPKSF